MSMPTATKKMAPKRSRTGSTRRSMGRTRRLPAASIPAAKAPRAGEQPNLEASTAHVKHAPTAATSRVSSRPWSAAQRSRGGRSSPPSPSRPARKSPTRARAQPTPPAAADEVSSPARSRMAKRSCTTSTENTRSRKGPRVPCSSKTLAMIMVLDTARAAAVSALSRGPQPRPRPARKPSQVVRPTWTTPRNTAGIPSRASLRKSNSRPTENISRITPSSARVWTFCTWATRGTGTWGPTMRPARR